MSHRTNWICDNFAYVWTALLATIDSHHFQFIGIKKLFTTLDPHLLIQDSFIKPMIAFVFIKLLDVTIGKYVKAWWNWLINKIKNLW